MIARVFFTLLVAAVGTAAHAAPLWHSVVLDSFDSALGVSLGPQSGTGVGSVLSGGAEITSDSITGRRDLSMARASGGSDVVQVTGFNGSIRLDSSDTSPNLSMIIQNDYFVKPDDPGTFNAITNPSGSINTGQVVQNGLDMTGAGIIAANGYSKFVLDIDATAGYEVKFVVFGADARNEVSALAGSYASATKTTSGGAELLEFDLADFDTKQGDFATNVLGGKIEFTWADVYGYAIAVDGGGITGASSFTINEVFATIPEPGSMLALTGLFGVSGLMGFRRKRAGSKVN